MTTETNVSIQGVRTALSFGTRYRVRYGRDDKILEDAELVERARNGDLVFRIGKDTRRVRTQSIDAIFASGTEVAAPVSPPKRPAKVGRKIAARVPKDIVAELLPKPKAPAPEVDPETAARRERENSRNRIWRCATCKRRTRLPECANGHPAVSAPAGKRRDNR
jgi:hypothetical protein